LSYIVSKWIGILETHQLGHGDKKLVMHALACSSIVSYQARFRWGMCLRA